MIIEMACVIVWLGLAAPPTAPERPALPPPQPLPISYIRPFQPAECATEEIEKRLDALISDKTLIRVPATVRLDQPTFPIRVMVPSKWLSKRGEERTLRVCFGKNAYEVFLSAGGLGYPDIIVEPLRDWRDPNLSVPSSIAADGSITVRAQVLRGLFNSKSKPPEPQDVLVERTYEIKVDVGKMSPLPIAKAAECEYASKSIAVSAVKVEPRRVVVSINVKPNSWWATMAVGMKVSLVSTEKEIGSRSIWLVDVYESTEERKGREIDFTTYDVAFPISETERLAMRSDEALVVVLKGDQEAAKSDIGKTTAWDGNSRQSMVPLFLR